MSRHERSGWRDEDLSRRHREWGFDCPAVDLDFVMVEYDNAEPVALIEYKQEGAMRVAPGNPSLVAIRRLADRAGVYAFVVRYGENLDWYTARALNFRAKGVVPEPEGRTMAEDEYVAFLHFLRGRIAQDGLAECIHQISAKDCKVCNGAARRLIKEAG